MNPPSGHFVSANNKIVPDSYPYFISDGWADPYRADRIATLLGGREKQSLDSTAKIAGDVQSGMARELLPLMLRLTKPDRESATAFELLKSWDYEMRADAPEPLIFAGWMREVNRELFEKRLGSVFPSYWGFNPRQIANILKGGTSWCGAGAGKPDCAQLLARSLDEATGRLVEKYGGDPGKWRWGDAHIAEFRNPVLAKIPLLSSLFANRVPADGGETTVNAGYMDIADPDHPFADQGGPGLRMILDFSDLTRSIFLFAPGTSGNPISDRYGDLLQRWRNFDWMVLSRSKPESTLNLVPAAEHIPARKN